jgi:hypothetical protein
MAWRARRVDCSRVSAMRQLLWLSIALAAACSAPDPGINGAVGRHPSPATSGGQPQNPAPSAPPSNTPPSNPPATPPPPPPPAPDAGVADAPTGGQNNSCGTPKCGADSNGGCGCIAAAPDGTTYFMGCNDQGCVCGQGQTVNQQFATAGACTDEASMEAAWAQCTCP